MIDLKEINFEQYITDYLVDKNSYILRGADDKKRPVKDLNYDRQLALDVDLLCDFIEKTQPKEWKRLKEIYGQNVKESVAKRIDQELTHVGALEVLRNGVSDRGVQINLMYRKPNSGFNREAQELYEQNIFSVVRQVYFSPKDERSVDMVLFINGIPVVTLELKNQLTGQTVEHAKHQYKTDRQPNDKLFNFKRALVHFAVDNNLAFMTTRINGFKTFFFPFNKGFNNGAGNPMVKGKFATHYLWEDILTKDSLAEIISRFMHVLVEKKKDPITGRTNKNEILLFPRYHQRDVVRKLIDDASENGAGKNYLIQHSAGSGKSNSIAWTAHNLSDLHDINDRKVFDKIIIITDRRVLDRQLRDTVSQFEQQRDVVKGITSSAELKEALQDKTKIIVSTLQKFPIIVEEMEGLQGNTFAVIVDEAHSSQSGESTKALKQTLSKLEDAEEEDETNKAIDPETQFALDAQAARGKLPHVSFFAFTATPKEKTLELFGEKQANGQYTPFSLYSMKQAIEEGFIIDVLQNYTTSRMYFELAQKAKDVDPEFEKRKAYKLALGYVDLHEHGIEKKAELMVEHFKMQIEHTVEGKAKAMIVTKSRLHAVRYYLAVRDYLARKGYPIKPIVAFSGTVIDKDRGGLEYTESSLNGFPETQTTDKFNEDEYKFLIVANKYQTGFDQPKLTAMYVDKKLGGVAAVQTLSRLNRTMHKKENVFVLDYANNAEDIQKAFQPYYTSTILSESTDPNLLYNLRRDLYNYGIFGKTEVDEHYSLLVSGDQSNMSVVAGLLDKGVQNWRDLDEDDQIEFREKLGDFVRKYTFIAQLFEFGDADLEKMYEYCRNLKKKLPVTKEELPKEVLEQIDLSSIAISKGKTYPIPLGDTPSVLEPMQPYGTGGKQPDEKERLSLIIKSINERFGLPEDMEADGLALVSRLKSREDVVKAIKNNPKGAARTHFDGVLRDELMKMFSERADFYKKLDEDIALRETLADHIFEELYRTSTSE
ncbi:type I restriction endonuclease subunit R [Candidatus Saccharibacteria bacterium]|nr:type I restriction endonuclease subunit R [Candidatus Saccharibacteria bacterium]